MKKAECVTDLRFVFTEATSHLGFSKIERAHLLGGKSPNDPSAYTPANIGIVNEALAQMSVALAILVEDKNEVVALMRNSTLQGLDGETLADCILTRSPERIKRAIASLRQHLGVA